MKERQAYRIYSLEDWRREKIAGEPLRIRVFRLTAIVWVPVVGLAAAVLIKTSVWVFVRIAIAAGRGIWRAIFR